MNANINGAGTAIIISQILIAGFQIANLIVIFTKDSTVSKSLAAASFLIFAAVSVILFKAVQQSHRK